jgi:YegS/Rv2252/BmrU family lipid kinase
VEIETITKEKVAFIINPKSGTKNKRELPDMILNSMDPEKFITEIVYTESAGHAPVLALDLIKKGYTRIVAVGGDGTVNEVARSIAGTHAALGIIPCGSGNGLARFLNIPLKTKDAIELISTGIVTQIDHGLINGKSFFCTCGVGFDAHIGNKFANSKKRGFYTYIKETISSFFNYNSKKYKIKVDGKKVKTRAFLITIANAGQWGNDVYIAPKADIQDGLLDICIVNHFPKYKAILLGFKIFNRTIDQSRYVTTIKGKSVTIKRKKKGEVHLDGEPDVMGKKLKIEVIPKGLNVIVP